MELVWSPFWYELDQTIVVGDIDYFYIEKDKTSFANGSATENDYEISAKIMKITHGSLGDVKAIITIGIDYTVYLSTGETIVVNAEESPGKVIDSARTSLDWTFIVTVEVIEESGISSLKRLQQTSQKDQKLIMEKRLQTYKKLLGTDDL